MIGVSSRRLEATSFRASSAQYLASLGNPQLEASLVGWTGGRSRFLGNQWPTSPERLGGETIFSLPEYSNEPRRSCLTRSGRSLTPLSNITKTPRSSERSSQTLK